MDKSTRTCDIDGCERPHNARGFCLPHYKRWRKYGDPEAGHTSPIGCAVEGCERPWRAREWCLMHYQRWKRHGDLTHTRQRRVCAVEGCDKFRAARGWCSKHHTRWKRHGSPTARMPGEVIEGKIVCSACGEDKPVDQYYLERAGRCRPCRAAYLAQPAHRAKRKEWAEANADFMRAYMRTYASARRARMSGLSHVPFTAEQLTARMSYFGNRCWICRGDFEHVDHVKPVAKGGPHMLANLRPACGACNRSKSAKWEGVAGVIALAA